MHSQAFPILLFFLFSAAALLAQENPDKAARIVTRPSTQPPGESRQALLMGVADVGSPQFPALPGIRQDLAKMQAALEATGFEVITLTEPTLREANKAVDDFGDRLRAKGGVGLFYFTGHGGEFAGVNYLLPRGARVSRLVDIQEQALSARRVLSRMEDQGTRVNIVFLDCCRNDMTKAASDTGLAHMSARGTFIGFATASEKTAAATRDGSPYTSTLASHLTTPGISILDMHTRVTAEVQDRTRDFGSEQTPFSYSGLRSDFYFVPGTTDDRPAPAPVMPAPTTLAPAGIIVRAFHLAAGVEMKFVHLRPGSFYMGSPSAEAGRDNDETLGHVRLSREFWIAQTECTQAQWQAVMGTNPSEFPGPDHPVETVSWSDAMNFCDKMNRIVKPRDGWQVTLPTEAQWEFACRATSQDAFSFGSATEDLCLNGNYADRHFTLFDYADKNGNDGIGNTTAPVMSYRANKWGLYDMHGNVWEWCLHSYTPQHIHGTDPLGSPLGKNRVARGGSWFTDSASCRSANRSPGTAETRRNSIGFRVVLVR